MTHQQHIFFAGTPEDDLAAGLAVIKIIADQADMEPEVVLGRHSLIVDLDLDSLDLIEVSLAVETRFQIVINSDDIDDLLTVRSVIEYVRMHRPKA